jgi:hypothetical protein
VRRYSEKIIAHYGSLSFEVLRLLCSLVTVPGCRQLGSQAGKDSVLTWGCRTTTPCCGAHVPAASCSMLSGHELSLHTHTTHTPTLLLKRARRPLIIVLWVRCSVLGLVPPSGGGQNHASRSLLTCCGHGSHLPGHEGATVPRLASCPCSVPVRVASNTPTLEARLRRCGYLTGRDQGVPTSWTRVCGCAAVRVGGSVILCLPRARGREARC